MKNSLLSFLLISLCYTNINAQKYSVIWGDDTKMKKGTVDMKLVDADKTGAYFLIGNLKGKVFSVTTNYKLKKFDANFDEVYEKDYSKTFKCATISSFNPLNNKLYAFADGYDKKQNIYTIDAAEINKEDGELIGETKEIGNYTLNSDRDNVDYVLKPTPDSTQWILITSIAAKDKSSNTVYITLLDEKLNKKATATIQLKQTPDLFSFADIAFTNTGKILLLGKEYEYLNGSTKKRNRVFKDFTLIRYSAKGDEEAVYKLDASNDKYSIGGKLVTLPDGEVVFAGFYSNIARGRKQQLNGIYTARIDANSNTLTQNSALEISTGMLTDVSDSTADDEDDENAKSKRDKKKDDDDAEGFSNTFLIRNVMVNPVDKSIIMVAESYKFESYYYYSGTTSTGMSTSYTEYTFTNKDMMLINLSADGQLKKISVIPKKQKESYRETSGNGFVSFSYDGGIFAQGGTYPYYSSIASLINNNKLILFYNDDNRNTNIKSASDSRKVRWTQNFNKSSLYALSVDLTTGNATKSDISDNSDNDIAMPRFAFVTGNTVYLPASKKKILGKTDLKIGKIVIKN